VSVGNNGRSGEKGRGEGCALNNVGVLIPDTEGTEVVGGTIPLDNIALRIGDMVLLLRLNRNKPLIIGSIESMSDVVGVVTLAGAVVVATGEGTRKTGSAVDCTPGEGTCKVVPAIVVTTGTLLTGTLLTGALLTGALLTGALLTGG
jgi:hypothetical protein